MPPIRLNWKTAALLAIVAIIAGWLVGLQLTSGEEVSYTPVERRIVDHTRYWVEAGIDKYEGSKTCMKCHEDEVMEVFHSYHYQEAWVQRDIAGKGEVEVGGKYFYNDFCGAIFWRGNVSINYIGKAMLKVAPQGYEDLKGNLIATGCSMCHGVSMGLIPSPEPTEEQLGNIDCLACHANPEIYVAGPAGIKKGLKIVYKDDEGRWRYMINPNISVLDLAANIMDKPTTENCLACHAFSGGGPHFKRPNLSPDMYASSSDFVFDVHIAKGLSCIDCHQVEDHAFPTASADTWSREPGHVPSCTDCHGEKPHSGVLGWIINEIHVDRVACQVCHIPYIAHGKYPTDVARNWSDIEFSAKMGRWEPELDLQGNLTPVYTWYNGTRQVYLWLEPVEPGDNGTIMLVKPLGSRDDENSKIYPFKLHYATVPYSVTNKTLVPVKVGIVFATGNVTKAIHVASKQTGIVWDGGWATLVRYMQVNHGVQPAEEALQCLDCHGPTIRRMPWPELGYGRYPEIAFTGILLAIVVLVGFTAYRLWFKR